MPTAARSRVGTSWIASAGSPACVEPDHDRVVDGAVGAVALGAAAQDRGIAGLEAERGGVDRHVGAALVDDADDAERHAHALDRHAVRPGPALGDLADRIGEIADHLDAGGHARDALVVEPEPVEEGGVGAVALGLGHVLGIGGEDRGRALCGSASAMAVSASFFCAVGASASTRAALRARCPISGITAAVSASTALSGAVMAAFMVVFLTRPPAPCMPIGGLGYPLRKGQGCLRPRARLPAWHAPCKQFRTKFIRGMRAMKLKDQVAIVTGAGRNIGEEVAKLFAAEGAKIAVVDLDRPRGQRTVDAVKAAGGDAELYAIDVSKGADVAAMVKAVVARFGRVDLLVNNVAVSDNKTIFECTEEDWDRVMTITLKSQFLMSKHVAQQMVAQGGGGKIVNVGSTSGWQGRPRAIAYSAAKAAIANFTRALAVQLAPHNIRVNAIVPNKIGSPVGKDDFDPTRPVENMLKRAGQPMEAAKAILFLVSDDLSFIIGENLFVDGGTMAMDQTSRLSCITRRARRTSRDRDDGAQARMLARMRPRSIMPAHVHPVGSASAASIAPSRVAWSKPLAMPAEPRSSDRADRAHPAQSQNTPRHFMPAKSRCRGAGAFARAQSRLTSRSTKARCSTILESAAGSSASLSGNRSSR